MICGIKTGLKEVEATDLEANPEETEAVVELHDISKKEASVETIGDWRTDMGTGK